MLIPITRSTLTTALELAMVKFWFLLHPQGTR
ncbi:hypothetical protein F441_05231 [Phytophthora nicotianae CJ01A1]|uniref:Uncharacterized protein n=2 Tax=Phytophthora nicotianae TaxID=4792 RepID=W2ZNY4_PHYNI|nr:hypothetical protein F441_05231 [Phytophthora nicotianae CJ01A1]ETP49112.1 hypothetical protein F442_05277 [Phytophthora nicotianae P10297]